MQDHSPIDTPTEPRHDIDRRQFLSMVGKGVGLATLASATVGGLYQELLAATRRIDHLPPSLARLRRGLLV